MGEPATDQHRQYWQHQNGADDQGLGVTGCELAPVEQQLRHPRQVPSGTAINFREARHHVADKKRRHAAANGEQDHRIDCRAEDFGTDGVNTLLIIDKPRQRAGQVTGAFSGLDDPDIERRKLRGLFRQDAGKLLAIVETGQQLGERGTDWDRRFLFQQGLERLDNRQAGGEQGEQLLAEQHEGYFAGSPAARHDCAKQE